jgi:hypothetical protein
MQVIDLKSMRAVASWDLKPRAPVVGAYFFEISH